MSLSLAPLQNVFILDMPLGISRTDPDTTSAPVSWPVGICQTMQLYVVHALAYVGMYALSAAVAKQVGVADSRNLAETGAPSSRRAVAGPTAIFS